ncbi:GTP cyclohydrolase [Flavobacterium sp. 9AF]|uniref:GTP cyclohydrolase n=1 Tax=Flavobacterium sp. 9AF TaxID=2653142 RepID=UPI0012F3A5CF|nr:GTP cyclohydrolase [Flavobacterium sp. 9AF]VXB74202.1 GTP cyclohydrolase [Flavobacterium sp. 9AF]
MITIKKAENKKDLKEYILFSFELYKNNPYWIPPIISEELETFDKTKNPAFQSAEAHFYLAYKEGKIVGKIAAIINWDEVNILKKSKVRFGWFDVIDDIEVTKALLEKVYDLGRQHNLEMVEGPIGFSNLDKVGVLVEGFEEMGNMVTWYNMPYYKDHFEKLGLTKEKEYIESSFSFTNIDPAPFKKISNLVKQRYQLRAINFTKTKEIMPYVDEMFDLFNETYAKLQSFVAINPIQKEYFKKKYIGFINPEYIKFILDKDNKMVAFAIVMPGFSDALKKAKGKLFPFGFYHLLHARKHSKEAVFYLIGVTPEYQSKGITAIIFEEYYKVFTAKGIHTCVRTPELEENNAIHNLWKNFDTSVKKRRRTYSKKL